MKLLFLTFSIVYGISIFAQSNIIAEMDAKEDFLKSIDINNQELKFKRLGGSTATNWRVSKDGIAIANLKCTQGNTFHKGAIVAYQLGRKLGLNIYPVAIPVQLDREIPYTYKVEGVRKLGSLSKKEECALKEWTSHFAPLHWKVNRETQQTTFNKTTGNKARLSQQLNCNRPQIPNTIFKFYSYSKHGSPNLSDEGFVSKNAFYTGESHLGKVSRDFSSMMLVDAIMGNDDRFPGGNVHFKSQVKSFELLSNGLKFNETRLFSLDNESVMRGGVTWAVRDLKYVTRFDHSFIENLKTLKLELKSESNTNSFDYLNFTTWKGTQPIKAYLLNQIELVLGHVEKSFQQCGEDSFFQ